jgi:hypothetical protein
MKSFIGQGDAQIESYRTSLFRLRDLFLNHATLTTEMTALQILDDMEGLSTKLDGISTQIKAVSNQVLDANAYAEKNKKEPNVAPVPTAQLVGPSQTPMVSQQATSWRKHRKFLFCCAPSVEPTLMVPERSSPGSWRTSSASSSIYDRKFLLFIHEV